MDRPAYQLAADTARHSYSRLLAILSSRTRDVALAEDALAGAFQAALETWPRASVPVNPEAWLLTTARRKLIDSARHDTVRSKALPDLTMLIEEANRLRDINDDVFTDERLKLMFVCVHPSIDASIHTPLILQTVLGLDAAAIARAFVVSNSTMSQRLVRAKRKIRDAGIPFEIPAEEQIETRTRAVLSAIYAAFTTGWDSQPSSADDSNLCSEAIWLGRLLIDLLTDDAETQGLLALMLYSDARKKARHTAGDLYVPLSEQDIEKWDRDMISEAESILLDASNKGSTGRFQLEAAIQSAHIQGRLQGIMNWPAIIMLYSQLIEVSPSLGAEIGRASAVAETGRLKEAQGLLAGAPDQKRNYQPYWACQALVESKLGNKREARIAYDKAIELAPNKATAQWLQAQRGQLDR